MALLRLVAVYLYVVPVCFLCCFLAMIRWGSTSTNRLMGRMLAWGALPLAGVKVTVENLETLEKHQPCVYVANHQSSLDVATFGSMVPRRFVGIGKKELWYLPFFGLMFACAGNLMIDRKKTVKAVQQLELFARQLRERQVSIWVFCEGTRNGTSALLLPFKKGAFHMAIQGQVPVVPVVSGRIQHLVGGKPGLRPGAVRIRVLDPIPTAGLTDEDVDQLFDTVWKKMHEAILGL